MRLQPIPSVILNAKVPFEELGPEQQRRREEGLKQLVQSHTGMTLQAFAIRTAARHRNTTLPDGVQIRLPHSNLEAISSQELSAAGIQLRDQ